MRKQAARLAFFLSLFFFSTAYSQQQDVVFHLSAQLLTGQNIIKVKRDFNDYYLWVLGQNNTVYRVNSLTLAVDDYTANFAAYSNLQFVDIMGRSADTVFIATNSTTLIESASGIIRTFGTADGIPGTINSVGIDLGWNIDEGATRMDMTIGTNQGMRMFNVQSQTISNFPDGVWAGNSSIANSKIYESTYRSETYKDSSATDLSGWTSDTLQYLPVAFNTGDIYFGDGAFDVGYVWTGNTFGNHVYTAIAVNEPDNYNQGDFAEYFWGTEKGMFQTSTNYSNYMPSTAWWHYLNGIKVNKITNILGLTAFSNNYSSPLIKQNLLVGTDSGFYFSNSIYNINGFYAGQPTMFHEDELGNTVINDICVNFVPDAQPICENGVWLGAANGLYLLKPDYGAYLNSQQQNLIAFANQPDTLSTLQVCSLTPTSAYVAGSYPNIQWYKDGAELPGESKDSLAITAAGTYNAVIYDPCEGLHIASNQLQVNIISGPVFTFNYPAKLQYCDSTSTTLNVTYSPSYSYRWYQDGILNGDTTSSLTVTQSGKYNVEVSACTNSWVPSSQVEVDLVNLPLAGITGDKNIYCQRDTAVLSANIPADTSYTISWYRDNVLQPALNNQPVINTTIAGNYVVTVNSNISACSKSSAGFQLNFTPAPTFTFNYPRQLYYCAGTPVTLQVQGSLSYQYRWFRNDTLTTLTTSAINVTQAGQYIVEVSACQNSWVPSNPVQVNFTQLAVPVISADKPAYCIGDNAVLSLQSIPDPDLPINWYCNNVLLQAEANQISITTTLPGSYTVALISSIVNTDGGSCSQTSAQYAITFDPKPTLSIQQIVNTNLCQGQTVDLKAIHDGGGIQWSTGDTADQIEITASGTYSVALTSAGGCTVDTSITVNFFPDPLLAINDTTICTYKNQTVTLTAPAGYAQYAWNNAPGGQTFNVTSPQIVDLTITDANGCQASKKVLVTEQCPDVEIPNTFTPNNDGINDTWNVQGLDATATVKIFNRWGAQLYQSKGYPVPWNGTYGGKKLPSGVYYYIITAKNGSETFDGWVSIIY